MPLSLPSHLVSVDWLKANLDHHGLVILDANVPYAANGPDGSLGLAQYRQEHIPGSFYAELQTRLSDAASPFGFTYPGDEAFANAIRSLGVSNRSTVVIYDNFLNMWATRIWLMLRSIGFQNVAVLDGGLKAWKAAGLELEAGNNVPIETTEELDIKHKLTFTEISKVVALSLSPDESRPLVCALPESYYNGTVEIDGRGGHIPGSRNLPASSLLDENGKFLPTDELRECLKSLLKADEVVLYCGGGISATIIAFALALVGRDDALVYDGSLSEWNSDPSRPLVAGAQP